MFAGGLSVTVYLVVAWIGAKIFGVVHVYGIDGGEGDFGWNARARRIGRSAGYLFAQIKMSASSIAVDGVSASLTKIPSDAIQNCTFPPEIDSYFETRDESAFHYWLTCNKILAYY